MAGKKGTEEPISEYLWLRIKRRVERMGFSDRKLAELLDEHPSTVNRMLTRKTRSVKFLGKLREVLRLPEDELEKRFEEHAGDVVTALARAMAYTPTRVDEWMDDVMRLATLHRRIEEIGLQCYDAERRIREAQERDDPIGDLMEEYDRLKAAQRELEIRRRKISRLLD